VSTFNSTRRNLPKKIGLGTGSAVPALLAANQPAMGCDQATASVSPSLMHLTRSAAGTSCIPAPLMSLWRAVVRADETIAGPVADTRILLGDELVCFGKLGEIRDKVCEMSELQDKTPEKQ
jgi:hypothetical protein